MNNWQAIGYIFLGFGLIFFIVGVLLGLQAASNYQAGINNLNQIFGASGITTPAATSAELTAGMHAAFINQFIWWVVPAAFCWVVAGVSVAAGTNRKRVIQSKILDSAYE